MSTPADHEPVSIEDLPKAHPARHDPSNAPSNSRFVGIPSGLEAPVPKKSLRFLGTMVE